MWNKTKKKRKRKSCWNYHLHLLSLLHGLIVISHWSIEQELAIVVFVFGCCIIWMYGFLGCYQQQLFVLILLKKVKCIYICMRTLLWLHIFLLCLLMKWSWTNRQVNSTLQRRVRRCFLFTVYLSLNELICFVVLYGFVKCLGSDKLVNIGMSLLLSKSVAVWQSEFLRSYKSKFFFSLTGLILKNPGAAKWLRDTERN